MLDRYHLKCKIDSLNVFWLSWDYLYEQIQLGLLDFKPSCQGGLLDVKLMNFLSCLRTTYLTYLWVDHWTKYIVLLDIKKIFLTSAGLNVRRKTWWVGLVIVIEFRSSFLHWHRWITTTIDNDQMAMQQLKLYKFLSLLSFKLGSIILNGTLVYKRIVVYYK